MNIADALAAVKFVMECGEVPMLVGEAGVGKTQLIEEIGAQTGRHVIKLMLSQMEPGDLIGLPVRDEANNKTRYLAPDWFPTRSDVILFLDEINRAHITVRSAVMQLLIDRRLHEHKLPDGVWLCAAMNPDTPDYEVEAIIDKAFIDRFVWIKVTNNVNSWREYNLSQKIVTAEYADSVYELFKIDPNAFPIKDFPLPELIPTPRAYTRLGKLLASASKDTMRFMYELSMGVLGKYGPKVLEIYLSKARAELTTHDLLNGDVRKVKAASSQSRVQALDGLVSLLIQNFNADSEQISIPTNQLENAAECLAAYGKEELGPLFRIAKETLQPIILAWKKASQKCRAAINNVLLSLGDINDIFTKLR